MTYYAWYVKVEFGKQRIPPKFRAVVENLAKRRKIEFLYYDEYIVYSYIALLRIINAVHVYGGKVHVSRIVIS